MGGCLLPNKQSQKMVVETMSQDHLKLLEGIKRHQIQVRLYYRTALFDEAAEFGLPCPHEKYRSYKGGILQLSAIEYPNNDNHRGFSYNIHPI